MRGLRHFVHVPSRLGLPSRSAAWWPVADVLVPFAATRLLLLLIGVFARYTMPAAANGDPWHASSHALIDAWAGWDSRWYVAIVQDGYGYQSGDQTAFAFWPGLPLLIKLATLVIGRQDTETVAVLGIVVANLALLAALFYLVRLVRQDFGATVASRAALCLLVFPASVFLSAVYPHSLFLACTTASFYYARNGAWWRAGLLGGFAAITRAYGVLLVLPLAWELGCQACAGRWRPRRDLLALSLVPAGLVTWMGYLTWQFGRPTAFLEAQLGWGRTPTPAWQALDPYLHGYSSFYGYSGTYLDLGFAGLYAIGALVAWRALPRSYAILASLLFLPLISAGRLQSLMRFGVELFPLFIVVAIAGRRTWLYQSYLVLGTGFAAVFAAMFALRYWVG